MPAFIVSFALRYWLPAGLYLLPASYNNFDPELVATGFRVSTYALIAFGFGSLILAPRPRPLTEALQGGSRLLPRMRLANAYIGIGLICFLLLLPIVGRVPTISALVIQGWGLLVAGLGLAGWYAWHARQQHRFRLYLLAALSLPFVTIVTQGFLGYGAAATTAVLALLASFYRPRWKAVIVGLVLAYIALSIYVTYMRDRANIRETVGLTTRVQSVYATVLSIEWFDLSNQQHLDRIDVRLNQNYLVGAAVQYLDAGLAKFAYAQTLIDGLLSLVPRIVWPSKPLFAGSGNIVSQYTGLRFGPDTAVGVGLVMESYISFGVAGVVGAFLLLGAVLTTIDRVAGQRLRQADGPGFVRWFLPGLAMLQTEGSIVEVTSSVGAAVVFAFMANRLAARVARGANRRQLPSTESKPPSSRARFSARRISPGNVET